MSLFVPVRTDPQGDLEIRNTFQQLRRYLESDMLPFPDDQWLIEGSTDSTSRFRIEVDTNVSANTDVVATVPGDTSFTLPGLELTQNWSGFNRFTNTGIRILDTDASHYMTLAPTGNEVANVTKSIPGTGNDSFAMLAVANVFTANQSISKAEPVLTLNDESAVLSKLLLTSSGGTTGLELSYHEAGARNYLKSKTNYDFDIIDNASATRFSFDYTGKLTISPSADSGNTLLLNLAAGTANVQMGSVPSATTYGGWWGGNVTPSATNYALRADGANATILNAATGDTVQFAINDASQWTIDATGLYPTNDSAETIGTDALRPSTIFADLVDTPEVKAASTLTFDIGGTDKAVLNTNGLALGTTAGGSGSNALIFNQGSTVSAATDQCSMWISDLAAGRAFFNFQSEYSSSTVCNIGDGCFFSGNSDNITFGGGPARNNVTMGFYSTGGYGWICSAQPGTAFRPLHMYSSDFKVFDGLTGVLGFEVTNELGSVVCGKQAALATNATDGFLYIPTCAGTPTGAPTAYTGKVAMVFDTTNNKLYIYDGSWLGGTAPGAWS